MDGMFTKGRITVVSVFLDSATGHSISHLQISTGDEETLAAKRTYEITVDANGVTIKSFYSDNGIYAEKSFTDDIKLSSQTIKFCSVSAHHQNGVAENHIGRLIRDTHTNLLHA